MLLYFFCNKWPKKFDEEIISSDMLLSKFFSLSAVKGEEKVTSWSNEEVINAVDKQWTLQTCLDNTNFRVFFWITRT